MPKKSLCGVEIEPSMLEPRNLSAKQPPSLDSGASCGPENQELVGILFSQALGNQCGVVCERSSTGKPVRGIENNLARKKLHFHNTQISDNQYLGKVFKNHRQKLNRSENEQELDQKTFCVDLGICLCQQR